MDTPVVCRLSVTVAADSLDAALQACRPLLLAFNVIALEVEPEAPSNSLHGFRAHLLVESPQPDGAGEEDVLRQAAAPFLAHFGAAGRQIHLRRSNDRLVAEVLPRKPAGQDSGVRMCGLSLMVGRDPFEAGQQPAAEPWQEPEPALTEPEADELVSLLGDSGLPGQHDAALDGGGGERDQVGGPHTAGP